jgi:uncharacterized membrane protein
MSLFWITITVLIAMIAAVSLVDLLRNHGGHRGWGIAGWALLIVLLPIVGSIAYWATRRTSTEEVEQQRLAEAALRQEAARGRFDSTAYRR